MHTQHSNNEKLRVLVAAHVGEPVGGITINYRTLLASSYSHRLTVKVVETSRGTLNFSQRGGWKFSNWLNAFANVIYFVIALVSQKIDVVHIATTYDASFAKHSLMALFARLWRTQVVIQIHCSFDRLIPKRNTLWRKYILFVLAKAQGIVTLSREWDALLDILPNANLCYVPNAIDVTPYQALARPRASFDEGLRLLFFGHIGREKGCFDLLDALEWVRQHTNTQFRTDFVGETLLTGEKEHLSAQIYERNLSDFVAVHEPEYGDAKMQRFANSDILILPSYHEGMPMSVIEAMAAGMAVIGSQVGGIPDQIIHGETGLLVPPGDVQALSAAILQLVEHPQTVLQMGQAGRKRAAEVFDIETKVQTLENFYYKLLAKN